MHRSDFVSLPCSLQKQTNKKLGQNKYVYVNSGSHMPPNTVALPVVIQELRSPCSKRTIQIFPPNMLVKLTQAKHHWYTGGKDLQCFLLPAADVLLSYSIEGIADSNVADTLVACEKQTSLI